MTSMRVLLLLVLLAGPAACKARPGAAEDAGGGGHAGRAPAHAGGATDRGTEASADERAAARPEPEARLRRAAEEARQLTSALLKGGVARREVTSIADIRGYRLYRRGRYREARVWFEAGVRIDPTFEPCLYNAARLSALVGDLSAARERLQQLRRRGTPLSARYLAQAAGDADFSALDLPRRSP